MSTILKWAGNKTAIMPELKKYLPAGPRLVEPFAGSCAVKRIIPAIWLRILILI